MSQKLVPINRQRHAATRVKDLKDFRFAASFHIAYLTMQEFMRGAASFPIVFLHDADRAEFRPVALLGLHAGENLFVDGLGHWLGSYVPAILRRHPFALAPAAQEGQYLVCIDEDSALLSQSEGAPLFDAAGAPTQVLDNVKRYLDEMRKMDQMTQQFCRFLAEQQLIRPLNMRVREGDSTKSVAGCFGIHEEGLNQLPDELHLEMKRQGYLAPAFAQLISLAQIERLVSLQDGRSSGTLW